MKTKRKLDREDKDLYELNIMASDRGTPPQTGTLTLHIKVGDINDNPPKFSYDELEVKVSETSKRGYVVMTLKVNS